MSWPAWVDDYQEDFRTLRAHLDDLANALTAAAEFDKTHSSMTHSEIVREATYLERKTAGLLDRYITLETMSRQRGGRDGSLYSNDGGLIDRAGEMREELHNRLCRIKAAHKGLDSRNGVSDDWWIIENLLKCCQNSGLALERVNARRIEELLYLVYDRAGRDHPPETLLGRVKRKLSSKNESG